MTSRSILLGQATDQKVKPFELWTKLAEGGFDKVFAIAADPDIEVGCRRFCRVAVKVPKPEGVLELRGEVKSLSGLSTEVQTVESMH